MYFNSGYLLAAFIAYVIAILALVNGFEIFSGKPLRIPFTTRRILNKNTRLLGGGLIVFGMLALVSLCCSLFI